jgi:hypothetical protein
LALQSPVLLAVRLSRLQGARQHPVDKLFKHRLGSRVHVEPLFFAWEQMSGIDDGRLTQRQRQARCFSATVS